MMQAGRLLASFVESLSKTLASQARNISEDANGREQPQGV